jgi:cobalt-zinc-cadmium resistance protein CzcA
MITRIIDFSLKNKFVIGLNVVAMIITGIWAMQNLAIDAVPDITNNQVQVVTVSPSLVPQEMEQFITYPVEMAVANIPKVLNVRSISRFGLSVVTIVFEDDVPVLEARQYVKEQLAVAESEIPAGLGSPEMMPITTGLGEIYQYTLAVDDAHRHLYDAMSLRTIQDWIVKRQLNGIKGIIEISSFGGYLKQYEIAVDPKKLSELGVTITEVYTALQKNNQNSGGSYIEQGPNVFYIRTEGIVKDFGDIENIVIKLNNGVPVLVKNIARIRYGYPPRFGAMTIDGKGETVGGITLMLKGANSSEAIENVHNRIDQVQNSLPEGISIQPYLDRSVLVGKTIRTVQTNLLEGGLIVIFVLILLLGNLRAGLIVASVIPLSLLFAFIMMHLFGVSANLMSLGALDFGIVIDGAVIIIESVLHFMFLNYLGRKLTQSEMDEAIKVTSSKIIGSAAFGVFIILIVFIPIMTLTGIEGKMFSPMAQTVSFAILGAFILSITYVPVAASLLLSKHIKKKDTISDRIVNFMKRLYKPSLKLALKMPYWVISLSLIMLLFSGVLFSRMGAEFIPTLEEGDLAMQMTLRPGSSLDASIRTSTRAEKILLDNFPEVVHVVSKIGTAEVPTDPMAVEEADIMIILKEKEEWVSANSREELVEKMKIKLSVINAASFEFTQPIQLRFNELMTGAKTDVAIKIFGDDVEILHTQAQKAADIIAQVEGAGDVKVEQTDGLPQMMVKFNRENMAFHGIDIQTLNQVIRSAYAGEVAGVVYEGERRFDMVIRLEKRDFFKLSRLFALNSKNKMVPLSELATMEVKNGPMQITREDAHRRIAIGINIRNRDVASFIKEVQGKLGQNLTLPAGYYIKYGGQFENLEAAKARLSIAVPISLGLIFVMLFFAFNSFKYAILIYTTVPMSAIGGVAALYIRDMPFSISAGVGFIALFGVAVLNGIVLISYFNQLKKEGNMSIMDIIITGGLARLRPVVMTAAVASMGFLPMALSTTAGAEVQKPLATVVIGGLISSTLLTLILLPIIYNMVEKKVKINKAVIIGLPLLIMSILPIKVEAQTLTLEASIDSALIRNQLITNAELAIRQAESMQKGAMKLGPTQLDMSYGQLNSGINDTYLAVTQNFGNPMQQAKATKANKVQVALQTENSKLLKRMLIRDVKMTWQDLLFSKSVVDRYNSQIEITKSYRQKAENRRQAGELSNSELGLIVMQQSDLYRLLALAEINYSDAVKSFKQLTKINNIDNITDSLTLLPFDYVTIDEQFDASLLAPFMKNNEFRWAKVKEANSAYFPELSLAYFNQSIDGLDGFQGVRGAVAFPLWFKPQKQAVVQAKLNVEIAQNNLAFQSDEYKYQYQNAINKLQKINALYQSSLDNWSEQNTILLNSVEQELVLGEIEYFKYVQITSRVLATAINRLELVNSLNRAIIEVEYFTNEI